MVLYYLTRPFARLAIWLFFRKIYLSNLDRIPKDRPVIISSNHPTGFLEPTVLAVFYPRPLHFLVRGDFFEKKWANWALRQYGMLPIWRFRDGGFRGLRTNASTFEECYQAFREGKIVMIFPEGHTRFEKKLRPVQKGLARLAFQAMEQGKEMHDLVVVPMGVNFTYSERFREQLMINAGDPIPVRDYWSAYQEDKAVAINQLVKDVQTAMFKDVVHIEHKEDELLVERLLVVSRSVQNWTLFPVLSDQEAPLRREKRIADAIMLMQQDEKQALNERAEPYFKALAEHQLLDRDLFFSNSAYRWWSPLWAILLAIPASIGYLFNYLPAKLADHIKATYVKRTEFYAPVMLAVGLGAYLFYSIFWLVVSLFTTWWIFVGAVVCFFLGYLTLVYREATALYRGHKKWKRLPESTRKKIMSLRSQLIDQWTAHQETFAPTT